MKKIAYYTIAALFLFSTLSASNALAKHKGSKKDKWQYLSAENVKNNPGLKHYVWESERTPFGPFEKIALHRVVSEPNNWKSIPNNPSPDKRKVIFVIPGTWSNGSSRIDEERYALNIYLANRGYDVYTMDFRTSYLPNLAYDQFESQGHDIGPDAYLADAVEWIDAQLEG
jgi:hypothetical protein